MPTKKPNGYAMFVVDLDGTLIGSDQQISARVFDAVTGVAKRITVSIATGREPADVMRFAGQLGLTAPQISNNGAMIIDPATGESLWSVPMGPGSATLVARQLQEVGTTFIATHPDGTITDAAQVADQEINRISALDLDAAAADGLVARLRSIPDLYVVKVFLPYNGLWAVDFTRKGVDKGSAIRKLAEMQGVETDEIIAAGDGLNDLPMLRSCGLSIAMGDSPDEVKAAADYQAPSVDDDGLAVAIEELRIGSRG